MGLCIWSGLSTLGTEPRLRPLPALSVCVLLDLGRALAPPPATVRLFNGTRPRALLYVGDDNVGPSFQKVIGRGRDDVSGGRCRWMDARNSHASGKLMPVAMQIGIPAIPKRRVYVFMVRAILGEQR